MGNLEEFELLDTVEQTTTIGTWCLNVRNQTLNWSMNTKKIHDVSNQYRPSLDKALEFYAEELRREVQDHIERTIKAHSPLEFTAEIVSARDARKWVKVFGRYDKARHLLFGAIHDITAQRTANNKLSFETSSRQHVLKYVAEAVITYACDGHILSANDAAYHLLGYHPGSLSRQSISSLFATKYSFLSSLSCKDKVQRDIEVSVKCADGHQFDALLTISHIEGEETACCVAILRDMSKEKVANELIEQLMYADPVTGLANRNGLIKQLESDAFLGGQLVAININHFNKINLACGTSEGDKVLQQLACRLQDALDKRYVIVRDLADRFFVLQPPFNQAAVDVATVLTQAMRSPILGKVEEHYIVLSIGITSVARESAGKTISRAENALLVAKESPHELAHHYNESDVQKHLKEYEIEKKLRQALEANHIKFWLQAKTNQNLDIVSAELLARWVQPGNMTLYSPDEFIPVAENTDLIHTLGQRAIEQAAIYLCKLSLRYPHFSLSVNVSPQQFVSQGFIDSLRNTFEHAGADLSKLTIEITENLLLHDVDSVTFTLQQLVSLGVKVALDDFGTGYSNLKRIMDLNIDEIKIDKSLIIGLEQTNRAKALVTSIVRMASSLNIPITVEGVETIGVAKWCQEQGIQYYQGYYFGKPEPFEQFITTLGQSLTK
ncbi:putative PAS domain S-box/diguanylate cyclase (GGDEF) domain-containing protein [Vibrio coralliirubri]|uniref:putative bifunctional diguanylate cyclase/phosphodiesterase n=1 Tax=Vibrio coralliirubri TaxID=1516159 RepID=UPI000635C4F4|nr:GGDEF domain-containing phosphodiesterase [Vibrio coralliirubri]CDT01484.1 putative PAS domain S-box/diguanylate cyclase (GGDEF) domain-containing protein [Vibrio coralliirubri]